MELRLSSLKVEDLRTTNAAMTRCISLAKLAAKSEVPTVLLGETGTGKTLLAQAIHNSSARAEGPFVSFNASAMSDTLLESQLFGHEKGAFTGAQQAVKGKFELANAGTIFLDEISDMSPLAQVKVLRVLEYGEFERLGSERMLKTDARIICATNVSLRERVRQGKFREDLYHRRACSCSGRPRAVADVGKFIGKKYDHASFSPRRKRSFAGKCSQASRALCLSASEPKSAAHGETSWHLARDLEPAFTRAKS